MSLRFPALRTFALTMTALAGLSASAQADTLSVVTFGGAYEAAVKKAYFEPFTKQTQHDFTYQSYSGGLAKLQAMVQAKNVTWDVVDLEAADAMRACEEGLLERFDAKLLGDTSHFLPGTISDCAVVSMVWAKVFAYDATKINGTPSTIQDFFDTQKFPGKRGMRKSAKGTMEWALLADGVPKEEVYALLATQAGVDRAFKKLDTIKSSIVWWESGAQPPQLLADGAVAMVAAYNGRISDAVKQDGKPFKIVWDAQLYDFEWWGVPKGSKNAKVAADFIAFASQPQRYADLTQYIPYSAPRTDATPLIAPERLNDLPTAPANFKNALQTNASFWVDKGDALGRQFQNWLTR